jgi:glyoxylase-like metal-dependent hydrolase (beta-lactamase superfamily II)
MKTQVIGGITVDRIVEAEGAFREFDFIIPGATQALVDANADWLVPRYILPDGMMIMAFHAMIVRTPRQTILVDCCVGNDKERPLRPPWHHQQTPFLDTMRAAGVTPEDIDVVMCTHLHADHVGWNTRLIDGRWVPTFPNAQYVFARKEYEHWEAEARKAKADGAENPPNHGSFDDSVLPVMEAGRAVLVEADHEIDHGVWLEPAFGHTPGNVLVNLKDGGRHAVVCGDTIHSPLQLCDPSLSSAFCEDPAMSARSRTAMVEKLADTESVLLAAHFPAPVAGRVIRHRDAFKLNTDI